MALERRLPHDADLHLFRPEAGTHALRVRICGRRAREEHLDGLTNPACIGAALYALARLRAAWTGAATDLVVGRDGVA